MVRLTTMYKALEEAFHGARISADVKTMCHVARFLIARGVTVNHEFPPDELRRIAKITKNSFYGKFTSGSAAECYHIVCGERGSGKIAALEQMLFMYKTKIAELEQELERLKSEQELALLMSGEYSRDFQK